MLNSRKDLMDFSYAGHESGTGDCMKVNEQDRRLLILAVLSSIFLLNDFLFMRAEGYAAWLLIDYGSRLLAVGIVLALMQRKISRAAEFGLTGIPFLPGLAWLLFLTATGILIDQVGWRFLEQHLPYTQLAAMPKIKSPFVNIFDLIFGITLVAVSEEIVFRGYCFTALHERLSPRALVALSAVLFGMIHWSQGLHAVLSAALWGILPMVSMIRTRSIIPAVLAHYITDLVSFGGGVPERWFDFMK
jgi:membrane protease YdiL (CAAX protease family)